MLIKTNTFFFLTVTSVVMAVKLQGSTVEEISEAAAEHKRTLSQCRRIRSEELRGNGARHKAFIAMRTRNTQRIIESSM